MIYPCSFYYLNNFDFQFLPYLACFILHTSYADLYIFNYYARVDNFFFAKIYIVFILFFFCSRNENKTNSFKFLFIFLQINKRKTFLWWFKTNNTQKSTCMIINFAKTPETSKQKIPNQIEIQKYFFTSFSFSFLIQHLSVCLYV